MSVVISGLGGWLPPSIVTNAEISLNLDTTPEWIETRTGIQERRMVTEGFSTRDLAIKAGLQALHSAGRSRIDALVVATTSPDRICPAIGPEVAARLELGNIAAYDITSACSGFMYGLATASGLIHSGTAENVLLVGAEAFTTFVNPDDRTTRPIFGDGAGAVVLSKGGDAQLGTIGPIDLGSDGALADLLAINAGGSRQRSKTHLGHDVVHHDDWYLKMEGRAIYAQAVLRMTESTRKVLDRASWAAGDIDWFVGHQANVRILNAVAFELGLPESKVAVNIDKVGNTLAASVPLLLTDMVARGDLKPGHKILISAFGAGLSWGSTVVTWPDLHVTAIK